MSGDFFFSGGRELSQRRVGRLLVPTRWRPETLLNILQGTAGND